MGGGGSAALLLSLLETVPTMEEVINVSQGEQEGLGGGLFILK